MYTSSTKRSYIKEKRESSTTIQKIAAARYGLWNLSRSFMGFKKKIRNSLHLANCAELFLLFTHLPAGLHSSGKINAAGNSCLLQAYCLYVFLQLIFFWSCPAQQHRKAHHCFSQSTQNNKRTDDNLHSRSYESHINTCVTWWFAVSLDDLLSHELLFCPWPRSAQNCSFSHRLFS